MYSPNKSDFSKQAPWFALEKIKELSTPVTASELHQFGIKGNIQSIRGIEDKIAKEIDSKQAINFRKIPVNDDKFIDVLHRFSGFLNGFHSYLENVSLEFGYTQSRKSDSYKKYLVRMISLYEENYNERFENLNSLDVYGKVNSLRYNFNYKEYNNREHRYPNASMESYKKYLIQEQNLIEQHKDFELNNELLHSEKVNKKILIKSTTKKKSKEKNVYGSVYGRNINESLESKERANWCCEINNEHKTFISVINHKPYVEAHHLIPMAAQDLFENTIDFSDNIISLCPNCHRKIHYGLNEHKENILKILWEKRSGLYHKYGIVSSFEDLKTFYDITK